MFKRTSEDLGLNLVLDKIASNSLSDGGAALVRSAKPLFAQDACEERQSQVASVMYAISRSLSEGVRTDVFPDISGVFETIVRDRTANIQGEDVYSASLFIEASQKLSKLLSLCAEEENPDKHGGVQDMITPLSEELLRTKEEIFSILESPGTVKDSYPTVRRLREMAERKRLERTKVAAQLMKDNLGIMQSDAAVMRDGRLLLPVRNDSQHLVEGYVQSSSNSGTTVFMEPLRLIGINNDVVMADQEIELEKARLVARLSDMVKECEVQLRILSSQVAQADFLYSFATWALREKCCRVLPGKDFNIDLIRARHPLLGDTCVPIDFRAGTDIKAVVLTGPNAGGKTVTMKTCGLFALLNQICGHFPADDGSAMRRFDKVFTDIGDEQSIENHLSTFSGHMKSISFILRSMTQDSLVILDELGSGTDPQEGAALARAIMEYCCTRSALTLTTSHHGVLKQYAYASQNVMNASMEFNEQTLEPTFKVISGLPGESHAIDTAKRMHLPKVVTSSAMRYMGQEAVKISSIIKGLEQKRREADEAEAELRNRQREMERCEKELEKERRRLSEMENRLRKEKLSGFDDYMRQSRRDLEALIMKLRTGELNREKTLEAKEFMAGLEQKEAQLRSEIEENEERLDETIPDNVQLKPGMDVLCGASKREGVVIRQAGKGRWEVAVGQMRITFKEADLTVPRRSVAKKVTYDYEGSAKHSAPKLELDLRGYRLEEALDAVEAQIESCCIYGLRNFSIIHGYGDGILSTGIHRCLKTHGQVANYCFAHPDAGGQGKTLVELK